MSSQGQGVGTSRIRRCNDDPVLVVTNAIGFSMCVLGLVAARRLGRKVRTGWLVSASCEIGNITYAVLLKQWVLIPWCLAYGWIYLRNFSRWGVHGSDANGEQSASKAGTR